MNITAKLLNWFEIESGEKLKSYDYNLIIHKYNVGDYFDKHIDSVERGYKNRAYVVGFHINDDYDGGEYILYNPDSIVDKTPGIPYFFKSDRLHEISKITKGIRKSAFLFVNYEDLIKKTTLI
jgi:predicted 2-oxoglutarate/Fe(II)-dependent dioxygenase YbiX